MAKISDCVAILDSIASRNSAYSPDVMGFDWFSLDMSLMMVKVDDGIWFSAMVETRMMKRSERQLWKLAPASSEQATIVAAKERAERLAAMEALYSVNVGEVPASGHELDCEPVTLAIGLAQAFRLHCPDEVPSFLLDENGELGFDVATHSNVVSNRKVARKHDRARKNSHD